MDWLLVVFLVAVALAAATGFVFRPGPWYAGLKKPRWTPPNRAFGPVWITLYVMIAIAGWRVWGRPGAQPAMSLWVAQLFLNAAWSWLFFGMRRMELAFVDIVLLWLSIAGFAVAALPVDTTASLLFLPYLAWVSVAAALNLRVWQLNQRDAPRSR